MIILLIIKTRLSLVYENNTENKVLILMNIKIQTVIAVTLNNRPGINSKIMMQNKVNRSVSSFHYHNGIRIEKPGTRYLALSKQ